MPFVPAQRVCLTVQLVFREDGHNSDEPHAVRGSVNITIAGSDCSRMLFTRVLATAYVRCGQCD